jgi:uncharacterized protein YjiS (DUF1127 family)
MESAMRESRKFHLSASAWSRMTIEQQVNVRRMIVAQARLARARALRELWRGPAAVWVRAAATLVAAWRAVALWRKRRQAVWELKALDDRSLRDIGLGRSEIESAVRGCKRRAA